MKKLNMILTQLPVPLTSLNKVRLIRHNIPLAAGYLKSFAHKRGLLKNCDIDILEYKYKDLAGDGLLIKRLLDLSPDVIGFSLYPWNLSRSLFIASEIKKAKPQITLLAGGPEADKNNAIISNSSPIDIFVIGEGEVTFCELLDHFIGKKPELYDINGIIYKKDDKIITTPPRDLIQNLNEIPSPYRLGFIKPENHNYFMWLEAQRGCLFNCKYCSWPQMGSHRKTGFSMERLQQEFEFAKNNKVKLIEFIDGSFNMIPGFADICRLIKKINPDKKIAFNAAFRADFITPQVADLLADCNFSVITVGLQSTNEQVLKNISRKINLQKFAQSIMYLKERGIKVMVDIILGLPGETPQSFQETLNFLTENKLVDAFEDDYLVKGYKDDDCQVFCYPLSVTPGTPLRKEISKWGFKIQNQPSYRILETNTFSFSKLKEAIEQTRKVGYFEPDVMFNFMHLGLAEFAVGSYPYSGEFLNCPGNTNKIDTPLTKIILEIDGSQQNIKQISDLASKLNSQLARTVTIWFKCNNPTKDKELIFTFLKNVSQFNPHTVWNILLETSKPFELNLIEEIKEHIYCLPNYLDYEGIFFAENANHEFLRMSTRIFTIISGINNFDGAWLTQLNKSAPYYRRLNYPEESVEDLKQLLHGKAKRILMDFAPRLTVVQIIDVLNYIHSHNNLNKEIFFTNWVIQRVWDIEYRKYAETLGTEENILSVDSALKNQNLTSFNKTILSEHLAQWLKTRKELVKTT